MLKTDKIKQYVQFLYNNKENNMREPRKLSLYQAAKIREYYEQGATQNRLATMYGVSKQTIKSIVQRKTYQQGV